MLPIQIFCRQFANGMHFELVVFVEILLTLVDKHGECDREIDVSIDRQGDGLAKYCSLVA